MLTKQLENKCEKYISILRPDEKVRYRENNTCMK